MPIKGTDRFRMALGSVPNAQYILLIAFQLTLQMTQKIGNSFLIHPIGLKIPHDETDKFAIAVGWKTLLYECKIEKMTMRWVYGFINLIKIRKCLQ